MGSENSANLLVGLAQVDITPPLGTAMAGYIRRQAPSQGTADPLFAKALYLNNGHFAVVLVILDVLLIDQFLLHLIRNQVESVTNLSADQVLVTATHTHSGPSGLGNLSFDSVHDQNLLAWVVPRIAECVREAVQNQIPAVLKSGSMIVNGFSQCRLDPQRAINPRLHMLRIEDANGRLIGIFANFPCHPTLLSYDNLHVSADWVGAARQVTSAGLGEDVIVIICNGASGDIHPLFLSQTQEDLQRLGQILGGAMISLAGQLWAAGQQLVIHNIRWGLRLNHSPTLGRLIDRPQLHLIEHQVTLPLKEYSAPEAYDAPIRMISTQLREKGVPESDLESMMKHPGFTSPSFSGRETAA